MNPERVTDTSSPVTGSVKEVQEEEFVNKDLVDRSIEFVDEGMRTYVLTID